MCLSVHRFLFHALLVRRYARRRISRATEHSGRVTVCVSLCAYTRAWTPSKICNPRYESVKISRRVLLETWQSVGITSTVNHASLLLFLLPSSSPSSTSRSFRSVPRPLGRSFLRVPWCFERRRTSPRRHRFFLLFLLFVKSCYHTFCRILYYRYDREEDSD